MIADRRFCQGQQQRFIHGIRRTLRSGIEAANRFHLVAEELDAHRALGFGRINIEDAAPQSILTGHLDDIGGVVADSVQVSEKVINVERFSAAQNASEIGIVLGGALKDGGRRHGRDHNRRLAGGDLPQGSRALFLQFGMRREILERKHVAGRQGDHGLRIAGAGEFAEASQHGDEILDDAVVVDYDD